MFQAGVWGNSCLGGGDRLEPGTCPPLQLCFCWGLCMLEWWNMGWGESPNQDPVWGYG